MRVIANPESYFKCIGKRNFASMKDRMCPGRFLMFALRAAARKKCFTPAIVRVAALSACITIFPLFPGQVFQAGCFILKHHTKAGLIYFLEYVFHEHDS